jgi:hypothetical protein
MQRQEPEVAGRQDSRLAGSHQVDDYCREIEAYLCRKNDGHLIRVVGPSFDLVSTWMAKGIPLKIACRGIDRYFERYYSKGPRRRPVRIDFCEADVLDAFDDWRRALGIALSRESIESPESRIASRASLPAHLRRVVMRLTQARARGTLGVHLDRILDAVSRELDSAQGQAGGLRGAARQAIVARLADLDAELLQAADRSLDEATRAALSSEADDEVAPFKTAMAADAYARARKAAAQRLIRERLDLPTMTFLQD